MRQDVQKKEVAALKSKLQEKSGKCLRELTDDCRLLVISHMPLAYAMAWRMKDYGVSVDDLRQEGCIGLCEAAMRYNEQVDCSFAVYASYWCRKMMLLAIDRYGSPVQLPARERRAIRFYRLDTEQTPQEEEDERGADSTLAAACQAQEDDDLLRTAQQHRIADAVQCLSSAETLIVRQFYGIDSPRLNLSEIASQQGVSRARASAIHCRALQKLEKALLERPLVDYLAPWLEQRDFGSTL